MLHALLLWVLIVWLLARPAHSQPPQGDGLARPSVRALALDEEAGIRLDGLLDEPVWQRAAVASSLRQQEPDEGVAATEDTEVRVFYDHETLYFGILARDREPDRVIARILARDKLMTLDFDNRPQWAGDDAMAILLDPFHDHRNAFVFATNPQGAEFDALITDEGREFNINWRGIWRVAARRVPEGWSAELAIPFRTLRYPAGSSEPWGFNIYRVIRRKNELVLWSAWSRQNEGFTRVSRAGHLEGLADLPRPAKNVEVKPFVLSGATREVGDAGVPGTERELDAGFDAKWEVRPGLVLDLTANTDFAQVEVDDQQVNLTRFDLFFPEKRDFFLENAGIFAFGSPGFFEPPPFLMFFSRRIGIADDGPVPILGGARLTGRVGSQTVGLLNVVTDSALDQPTTNFAVLRAKRDVFGSGYLGAMVTDRRTADTANTVAGLDWSVWPTGQVNVQGFVARTGTTGPGGDDVAGRVNASMEGDHVGFNADYLYVGPEARAEMGFITRDDIHRTSGFVRGTIRPGRLGLRRLDTFLGWDYVVRSDGLLQDRALGVGFNQEFESGESLLAFHERRFTRLDESFNLTDDVTVGAGDYDTWTLAWFFNSSSNRPVAIGSQGSIQHVYDGSIVTVGVTTTVAAGSHLSFTAGYTHNVVDIPAGAFTARLGSLRLSYAFSTRLVANALLQYNSLDNVLSANVRLNLIHRPGSDLFIVFNEERGSDSSVWDFANRGGVIKVTYLARL
jgi:hypothetical protein